MESKKVLNEGYLDVRGGQLWYQVVGTKNNFPILVLSGGPGTPHYYLKSLSLLGENRQVVFYDQLGCGKSSHNTDESLWTMDNLLEHIELLVSALGFDKLTIFAHSWGSILAIEYTLKHPEKIINLILEGPCISVPKWIDDAWAFRRTMSKKVQESLNQYELLGQVDWVNYERAVLECYKKCFCILEPWPQELLETAMEVNQDMHKTMWGINAFYVTSQLSEYDASDRLPEIKCPILLTRGTYDIVSLETAKSYERLIHKARLVSFENSSHTTHIESPTKYITALQKFLLS